MRGMPPLVWSTAEERRWLGMHSCGRLDAMRRGQAQRSVELVALAGRSSRRGDTIAAFDWRDEDTLLKTGNRPAKVNRQGQQDDGARATRELRWPPAHSFFAPRTIAQSVLPLWHARASRQLDVRLRPRLTWISSSRILPPPRCADNGEVGTRKGGLSAEVDAWAVLDDASTHPPSHPRLCSPAIRRAGQLLERQNQRRGSWGPECGERSDLGITWCGGALPTAAHTDSCTAAECTRADGSCSQISSRSPVTAAWRSRPSLDIRTTQTRREEKTRDTCSHHHIAQIPQCSTVTALRSFI
jgi:hypothetical protein